MSREDAWVVNRFSNDNFPQEFTLGTSMVFGDTYHNRELLDEVVYRTFVKVCVKQVSQPVDTLD